MSVLLPNDSLSLRRAAEPTFDAHGAYVRGSWAAPIGPYPGAARESAQGVWTLCLDIALWPVREGDVVVSDSGQEWLVTTSQALHNVVDPTVDYVRCEAHERQGSSTEPTGPEFVGR